MRRGLSKVDKIFVDDAAHPVKSAVYVVDARIFSRLQNGAHKTLVDDCGRAAALRDYCFSHKFRHGSCSF
jgi:hypothetical protein